MEMFSLKDKVAIITGASRGIGKSIALKYAQCGAKLVLAARNRELLEQVAQETGKFGSKSLVVTADVGEVGDIDKLVQRTVAEFGRIDILVNNAGVSDKMFKSEEMPKDYWDYVLKINLTGVFLCAQAVGREMIKQKKGKIINIASVLGAVGNQRILAYCVAKGGVIQITKVLAIEWARHNIQVNAVAPGWVETDMTAKMRTSETIYKDLLGKIPIGRFATAEEISGAAVFLASEEANYITGHTIFVDGGQLAM